MAVRNPMTAAVGRHGVSMTYRSVAAGTYDPATGKTTPGSDTDIPVQAVPVPVSETAGNGVTYAVGDERVLVAADPIAAITPKVGDEILDGSTVRKVLGVSPYWFQGVLLGFEFHVRGAIKKA